jgi:ribosomal protein S18 acetylase RimI-like enzyme
MTQFRSELSAELTIEAADFFEGWPVRPSQSKFMAALRGSFAVEIAVSSEGRAVGFVNAISDGVAAAFVPWLEVVPASRGRGIGRELTRRMMARLDGLYSVDLVCDPDLVGYYRKLGLREVSAMALRRPANLGE